MANHWFVYTQRPMTFEDIRRVTGDVLIELMPDVPAADLAVTLWVDFEGHEMSDENRGRVATGDPSADESTGILRLRSADRIIVDTDPATVSAKFAHGDVDNVLAIACAIGVARFAGSRADYGYSILPDVTDDRDLRGGHWWDGHDPNDLTDRLRLRTPITGLAQAARAVLAPTGLRRVGPQ